VIFHLFDQRSQQRGLAGRTRVIEGASIELVYLVPDLGILADAVGQGMDREIELVEQRAKLGRGLNGCVGVLIAREPVALAANADDLGAGRRGELRFSGGLLSGDLSGNRTADLRVQLLGVDRFSPDWIA
jgi:hypothetical protein